MGEQVDQAVKCAGWVLMAMGVLSILLMSQHPSGNEGGIMTPLVHGGLQAVMIVQIAALLIAVRSWGWTLLLIAGVLFFGAGQLAGIGAATINGFVVPSLGGYGPGEIGPGIGALAWEVNQALARLGVIAIGIGFAILSVRLWRGAARVLAITGWIAGLVPSIMLMIGHLSMELHGALFAYITQAAWIIALGWYFTRQNSASG